MTKHLKMCMPISWQNPGFCWESKCPVKSIPLWKKPHEMPFRFLYEVMLAFKPQNHTRNRTSITAKQPVTANKLR